ncbi:tricarballylate dehydrogenase [Colletotrichum kahawae]|uniref:Tricarballylate dehydrogenase n=1 Tax=Colletotrichum kahawae TaxID=34407 RepID=A0AAE0CX18_COLKA|nr:tricarballylate dehydrogenase [Colletotrichum kahawae]
MHHRGVSNQYYLHLTSFITSTRLKRTQLPDVVVVGGGVAGACASIAAAEKGAKVLLLDDAHGGGASALSGGVVYAGGGTRQQKEAGYGHDSPDNMFAYLKEETGDAVDDKTLRRFCDESVQRNEWLEKHGARFEASLCPYKTSYPTNQHYLYLSGNEKSHPFNKVAEPAPRGHRMVQPEFSGGELWRVLFESALRLGVNFQPATKVQRVLFDGQETIHSRAVVLSAGGFAFNHEMRQVYLPEFSTVAPLGTQGDDGSGINIGVEAGGSVSNMNKMSAWRFLYPPTALVEGVVVAQDGRRFAAEDMYGATLSDIMIRDHDAKGFLILDSNQRWLGSKLGVSAEGLKSTVEGYNRDISNRNEDRMHKASEYCTPLLKPPFYGVDISCRVGGIQAVNGLTLGGLRVDGDTGLVLTGEDKTIPGLYAAGRTAVGICANGYVSGLSIADGVFSGKRAGEHAARERHDVRYLV